MRLSTELMQVFTLHTQSLLLAASANLLLSFAGIDAPEHHHAIAVHESDTTHAFAIFESIADQRLLGDEAAFRHLVWLQRMGLFHFLPTRLLPHLPLELRNAASGTACAHESDRRVPHLDLVRDIENLNLRIELTGLTERGVFLVHHHVTRMGHVVLVKTLNVQADVITWVREVDTLMVHLHREDLPGAGIRGSVRWQKNPFLARFHDTLFHTTGEHVTDAFDFVDARNRQTHRRTGGSLGDAAEFVQAVIQSIYMNGLFTNQGIHALPPIHVRRLFQQIITDPARDGEKGSVLFNEILLPSNFYKRVLHLIGDFFVACLLVTGGVTIHLVHADDDLLHTEQVDETSMLPSLTLDLASFVVALGDRGGEISIRGHHDK